jgi:hypothetical protein
MSQIFTPEEVAEHFKIEVRLVKRMTTEGKWPHIRINKLNKRFTAEHIEQIEQMLAPTTLTENFGRKTK